MPALSFMLHCRFLISGCWTSSHKFKLLLHYNSPKFVKVQDSSAVSLSVLPPFKVRTVCSCPRHVLSGFKPFSKEIIFSIHDNQNCLIAFPDRALAFKMFSEDGLPSPYPSLFSSGVLVCQKQWDNICMLLLLINYGDSAQHVHFGASLLRSDISNFSWKLGEYMWWAASYLFVAALRLV